MATLDEIEARARSAASEGMPLNAGAAALDAILALVVHVRALDASRWLIDAAKLQNQVIALEAKVAALAQDVAAMKVDDANWETNYRNAQSTLGAVRAENAELRKANENIQHVAAEYEERIKALQEQVSQVRRDFSGLDARWPAPQPIETAPLGRIMVWVEGERALPSEGYWTFLVPARSDTLETWRAALRDWGHRWWMPEPPPPGGGK